MANSFKSKTDTAIGTSAATLYTCPSSTQSTIIGLTVANIVSAQIVIDVQLDASGRTAGAQDSVYIIKDAPIPVGSSLVVVGGEQKVVMEPGDTLKITSDTASSADAIASLLEITQEVQMPYIGRDIESITFNSANNLNVVGNITLSGTVDGRDVAADGTKLDTIATNAIANLSEDTTPQLGGNLDLNTNNVIGTGNINVTGSITGTSFVSTGDMSFTNNSKAKFGTSPSLEIYHDGSNSILDDVGAGNFKMQLAGSDKLEVTSTGIDVTGTVTANQIDTDNIRIDGNTISSTDTNGDITLDPNGSGDVVVAQVASSSLDIEGDRTDAQITLKGGSAGAGIQLFGSTYTNYAGAMYLDATASTTGTNDAQMVFRTGSTPSEAMRIDRSGNVGIGKSSSITDKLHIENTGANCLLSVARTDGAAGRLVMQHTSSVGALQTTGSVPLTFGTADTERLRIDSSGKVAIGTTSTAAGQLTIQSSGNQQLVVTDDGSEKFSMKVSGNDMTLEAGSGGSNSTNLIFKTASSGTESEQMRIDSSGNVGIGVSNPVELNEAGFRELIIGGATEGAAITLKDADANVKLGMFCSDASNTGVLRTITNHPLAFRTNNTERMRIQANGCVGIGYADEVNTQQFAAHQSRTNAAAVDARSTSTSYTNQVLLVGSNTNTTNSTYNHIRCDIHGVAQKMAVRDSGNLVNANNSYGSLSDSRLKENIVDAASQWDDIKALQVRRYNRLGETQKELGVIAQELEASGMGGLVEEGPYYDAVNNPNEEIRKSVKYSILYMKAIKALQEAMTRIETLETKVAALEAAE